jgi:hypothetical protein
VRKDDMIVRHYVVHGALANVEGESNASNMKPWADKHAG